MITGHGSIELAVDAMKAGANDLLTKPVALGELRQRIGLLEAADGGSLFLDEIGEMDRALQAKLLKVIEDGRVRRLGAVQERQVNVRIVAATNQDLEDHIRQGLFRADLYFRLRVLQINVPPLRERVGDPLQLARHFLVEFGQRYRKSGLAFTPADLLLPRSPEARPAEQPASGVVAPVDVRGSALERVEREMLVQALTLTGGNVSRAARELGISRDTLRYRMEKYAIGAATTGL